MVLGGLGAIASSPAAVLFILLGVGVLAWYFVPIQGINNEMRNLVAAHQGEVGRREEEFQAAHTAWQHSLHQHDQAEWARVNAAMEFYPLELPAPARIDVFGGTGAGWTSLLATGGASLLASAAGVLLLDLSELSVGAGLVMLANNTGPTAQVDVRELPASLERTGLLAGCDARQAAELLADAFDADRRGGGDSGLRAIDLNVLRIATTSISAPLTFIRLAAALRVLDNQSSAIIYGVLREDEIQALQQRMYDLGQRERTAEQVSFLRTELETLAGPDLDAPGDVPPAASASPWWPGGGLRVIATTSSGRGGSARRKLLTDRVLVEVLLHRLRADGSAARGDAVVIAGADHLGQDTLNALTQQAERARVRLILLFKNLSADAERLIGTGDSAAIFMRMGNAREATAAAEHIGKGFRFVLSQVTNQVGTGFTEGFANSYGEQDGTSRTDGEGGNRSYGPGGRSGGTNWNSSTTTSHSTTWTNTVNVANSVNQTAGSVMQREKDYSVEPTVLQSLAPTAFILVGTGSGPARVRPGDCNPGLVLLPKVAADAREFDPAAHSQDPGRLGQAGTNTNQQIPAPQQQNPYPPGTGGWRPPGQW